MNCIDCGDPIKHKGVCDVCLKLRIAERPKQEYIETPLYEFKSPTILDRNQLFADDSRNFYQNRAKWQERSKQSLDKLQSKAHGVWYAR